MQSYSTSPAIQDPSNASSNIEDEPQFLSQENAALALWQMTPGEQQENFERAAKASLELSKLSDDRFFYLMNKFTKVENMILDIY